MDLDAESLRCEIWPAYGFVAVSEPGHLGEKLGKRLVEGSLMYLRLRRSTMIQVLEDPFICVCVCVWEMLAADVLLFRGRS